MQLGVVVGLGYLNYVRLQLPSKGKKIEETFVFYDIPGNLAWNVVFGQWSFDTATHIEQQNFNPDRYSK
jgi:hypothetical protein